MTSLRFVGDVPLWLGLILSALVAVMAWRYYRRESFDLPRRLRWLLPLLRSLAFVLGIMLLTGPVLHHRKVIGELGRVRIYVDASQSMELLDRHIGVGRKLLIAEQQGWLEPGRVDARLLNLANELSDARQTVLRELQAESISAEDVVRLRDTLLSAVKDAGREIGGFAVELPNGEATAQSAMEELTASLEAIAIPADEAAMDAAPKELIVACEAARALENRLRQSFSRDVQKLVDSDDESVRAALAMFDETTRWRRAERSLLDGPDALFDNLKQHHNVEVIALHNGEPVKLLDSKAAAETPREFSESADAATTDLISGITATQTTTLRSDASAGDDNSGEATRPNTAIVLLTDGQHNAGPSPLQAARVLGGQGIAFYPVSLGAAARAPDLSLTGLEHPQMVFRSDRVRGTMIIQDDMPAGQPMLLQVDHDGELMWEKQLLTEGSGERRIDFEFGVEELVDRIGNRSTSDVKQHAIPLNMTARITPLQDEAEVNNNQQALRFAAITQNHRLLIIDGRSRWETRYLRNVFERDSQWDVSVLIVGPGNDTTSLPRGTGSDMFPETREALFEYDLIIFGEVAAELFADHEFQWMRDFVETRGGGIVFVDGQRKRMQTFTDQNLGPLLPVEWRPEAIATAPVSLQLTDKGAREPALTFETETQANQRFWTELPPPHTLNHVVALPGAEVLLEAIVDGKPTPVMVTRRNGAGRVLYLAFDETWRWRYKAADTYHQRIWNQLAKFVMPRPFAASDEYLAIDTGPVSYANGESADIRVRLKGLDGKPTIGATVDALIRKDGRVVSTAGLIADLDVPGIYRGGSGALAEGEYEVSVRASGFSEQALQARGQFVVLPPETSELKETACNEPLLQQMAADSGGIWLREEQIGQLSQLLSPLSTGHVEDSDTVLWQSYWWFAAVVILLTLEWFLRKRAGLL